jgi:hypothetical protein
VGSHERTLRFAPFIAGAGLLAVFGGCMAPPRPVPVATVHDDNAYERAGHHDPGYYGGVTVVPEVDRMPAPSDSEGSALPREVASAPGDSLPSREPGKPSANAMVPSTVPVRIDGVVESGVSGIAVVRAASGQKVTVDLSTVPGVFSALAPGRPISVYGDWVDGVLTARTVTFDYAPRDMR